MSRTYILAQQQFIPRTLDEVFAFFSDAANLQSLTPDTLHFEILTPGPIEMRTGTLIDYRLRLFGVPLKWRSKIIEYDPFKRFADVQVVGPYRRWCHTHEFEEVPEGTLMTDRVEYELPWGPLGTVAHAIFVKRSLAYIFDYRRKQMEVIFPRQCAEAECNGVRRST